MAAAKRPRDDNGTPTPQGDGNSKQTRLSPAPTTLSSSAQPAENRATPPLDPCRSAQQQQLCLRQGRHETAPRLKRSHVIVPQPEPSAVMGVSAVAARVPIADNRHFLASMLTDSEARRLVNSLATFKLRGNAAAFINTRYDDTFAPQPDQLVSFNALVTAIKTTLEPLAVEAEAARSSDGSTETPESLMLLQQTLADSTATGTGATPNKSTAFVPGATRTKSNTRTPNITVTTNLRVIHAAAVPPASFGTRLNALRALLSVNTFLITRALLSTSAQRDIVEAALGRPSPAKLYCLGACLP
ncbi:hypothetical protein B0T26DRAFT_750788 [Lasiosphaeria miniovina]|uniref:Uncharacterized protein n=1 Tax=Lasiosphaeria miniovina TaxID=1954250 RepID=A0AA40AX00_9PEZI|nr:uncharacterized protein B0T26DRAFT_750788 [Lasiosphaeria miniovina]KAK0723522.1 hypothetical protein B0T26DRAFT_750788 [Lasiosphaeria miniovina]